MPIEFSNPQALGHWKAKGYADEEWPMSRLQEIPFKGGEPLLYPTQPQQLLKTYHRYDYARYDKRKIAGTGDECVLSMLTQLPAAAAQRRVALAQERGRRINCLQGDVAYDLLLSSTYTDDRGNLYRGVTRQQFLESHESMGHSVAAGHTVYERSGSQFANAVDAYDGNTYAVALDEFLLIAQPFPADRKQIARLQQKAGQTHRRQGLLWVYTGQR